jgi:hypothetical protein
MRCITMEHQGLITDFSLGVGKQVYRALRVRATPAHATPTHPPTRTLKGYLVTVLAVMFVGIDTNLPLFAYKKKTVRKGKLRIPPPPSVSIPEQTFRC